ncbi:MAG: radical SAM protein [Planctomycetes bacterium]|nr:radical SAM protein [Planctomycetota bacterium]
MNDRPKVLLINPWIFDFTAYDLWLKPLGLLIVSDWLKTHFDVELIDCMDRKDPELALIRHNGHDSKYGTGKFCYRIVQKPAVYSWIPRHYKQYGIPEEFFLKKLQTIGKIDAVGITSIMTYWYPGVKRAVELVRSVMGDVPIILGGIYARLCKEHAKRVLDVDIVSDAWTQEEIINEFNKAVGSTFKVLSSRIQPDYSSYERVSSAATITQLGCPFKCTYCASPILFKKMLFRPTRQIADEITDYEKNGIRDLAFYDDALLMGYQRNLGPLLDELIDRKVSMRFHTPNAIHAREVTPEVAFKMKKAGFKTIRIGLETSDERRQEHASNSKVNNQQFIECINNIRNAGFDMNDVGAYVLMGLPDQTYEEIVDTFMFVNSIGVKIYISMFSPVPGTPEYQICVNKYGLDQTEPLFTNKTLYGGVNRSRYFELERIRQLVLRLNKQFESKHNLYRIMEK